jgi:hypothetical protein
VIFLKTSHYVIMNFVPNFAFTLYTPNKGKSLSVDMRKLIVDNNKLQSGERQSDISKTISLCNQRSLVNIPKSGRPRKTDKTTDRKIGMVSRQNPFWNAVKIKKEIPNVRSSLLDVDL